MIDFLCNIWNVEHGSSALIKTPNDKYIMLDAGSSSSFSPAEHLYSKGIRDIETLVISHPHEDHLRDLPKANDLFSIHGLLRNKFTPKELIDGYNEQNPKEPFKTWFSMTNAYTSTRPSVHDRYSGVELKTFYASPSDLKVQGEEAYENLNNHSLVLFVEYKDLLVIFPGDLEPHGWDLVLDQIDQVRDLSARYKILVAPHHGRKSGTYKNEEFYNKFLEKIQPTLTVISDKYGSSTTCGDAYRRYSKGMSVISGGTVEEKKVITTKTNNYISIQVKDNILNIKTD